MSRDQYSYFTAVDIPLGNPVDADTREGRCDHTDRKVDALFRSTLHQQWYNLVLEVLESASITRVLDMGCNDYRFLRLVKARLPQA